ncbi:hypothetical protein BGZ67_004569 [Mortierella alpina]|nr:hypothetical protein BGZ67_004569 [Mortierella alpina]
MSKVNIHEIRGFAFQVHQEIDHLDNPYTFQVTLSRTKVIHGACTKIQQTQVELHDVGGAHCFAQYSHMLLVQNDMLVGSSQISKTASRIAISLSTAALQTDGAFRFGIILQSRSSSHDLCRPVSSRPIAVYSPWKGTATGNSSPTVKPTSRPKPSPSPKTATSPKPAPSSQRPRMDLSNNLFRKPLSLAVASMSEHQEPNSRSFVNSTASSTGKVHTSRSAPQGIIICKSVGTQHEQGPETVESTLFDDDQLTSGATVGPPYDVHFYHADQTPARSRGVAAHRDVLSVFPKLKSLIANADIGRSIIRGKLEWSRLGSGQAGRQTPVVVDISHFSYDAFRALIVYIYTGDFDLALSYVTRPSLSPQQSPPRWIHLRHEGARGRFLDLCELRELLRICGTLDVDGLRYACVGMALSFLSAENAVFMLVHLGRDVPEIKRTVMALMKDHVQQVLTAGKCSTLKDLFEEFKDQDCSDLVDDLEEELRGMDAQKEKTMYT